MVWKKRKRRRTKVDSNTYVMSLPFEGLGNYTDNMLYM